MRGVLWMLASAAGFTIMAACIKHLANQGYPETQMILFRAVTGFALLVPVIVRVGPRAWATPRPWMMARRCVASAIGMYLGFYAFAHMPLATAQSLSFTRTLFVVVLAIVLLHEKVGIWRLSALAVGFVGVLVMLRPDQMQVDLAAFAALTSALMLAFSIVTIKDMTRDHSTLSLVLWLNLTTSLAGLPFAFFAWQPPNLTDTMLLMLLGVVGVLSQTSFTRGMAAGDASLMALMDYVRLPMMALAGFVVFRDVLDGWTLAGALIVIGSTVAITLREAALAKRRAPPTPE